MNERAQKLFEENQNLVGFVIGRYGTFGADIEDLSQELYLTLWKAALGFDADRGTKFSTYAIPAMLNTAKRFGWWATHPTHRPWPMSKAYARAISDGLAAKMLPCSSFGDPLPGCEDESLALEDVVGKEDTAMSVDAIDLHDALKKLDRKTRRALNLRYERGMRQYEIAKAMGISQSYVSRMIRGAENELRRKMRVV